MRSLPELIYELANKAAPKDGQNLWVNDHPNGFIFLAIMVIALFFKAFLMPLLGL
jgi:hypothetical protein